MKTHPNIRLMPKWLKEFKEFSLRGNMIDLAIGVIIGTAFGQVVNSLVSDIILPPIGLLIGGVDFSAFSIKLHVPGTALVPVEIKYGLFINTLINLVVIAGAIFLTIKLMNRFYRHNADKKECPDCLMKIPAKAKKCCYCTSDLP